MCQYLATQHVLPVKLKHVRDASGVPPVPPSPRALIAANTAEHLLIRREATRVENPINSNRAQHFPAEQTLCPRTATTCDPHSTLPLAGRPPLQIDPLPPPELAPSLPVDPPPPGTKGSLHDAMFHTGCTISRFSDLVNRHFEHDLRKQSAKHTCTTKIVM